jgi:hypothetical protein
MYGHHAGCSIMTSRREKAEKDGTKDVLSTWEANAESR